MAATDACAGSGALPDWVMLERFIFRRDDPKSFREDKRTSATGKTSVGARFRVSFILAEPPTPSRLYLSWPEGPKREKMCHLVAAHRNLVLLRLDSFVDPSNPSPFGEVVHDYFIYIAYTQEQSTPVLKRLPSYTEYDAHCKRPLTIPFESPGVGLLCCGEECCGEEFAVAYLTVCLGYTSSSLESSVELEESDSPLTQEAMLWLLRSTVSADSAGGGEKWESKNVLIYLSAGEDYNALPNWKTHEVVPYNNGLCWVDYNKGVLRCEDVFGDNPKVFFFSFLQNLSLGPKFTCRSELYRSLCVTSGGRYMALLDVVRDDGAFLGRMLPDSSFTITYATLPQHWTEHSEESRIFTVKASELWRKHPAEDLPREVMMLPLLSMDEPYIVYFVLYDWAHKVGKFSLVTIDLRTKSVVGSVVPYINGEEDLSTDIADMVKAKPTFFMHFLPTEFPKFLKLHRKRKNPA